MTHGRVVRGAFVPHPLLRNAHVQTLLPLLRPTPRLELRIERRELPDGDFVDLGWCARNPKHGPLVVLLHGLTGGFDSKYARGLARKLLARGWRVVILQFRGAGPEPNRLTRHYHQGDTQDLRELLAMLRATEPQTKLFAVGWSLGGNVLMKYLGEEGAAAPLAAAVAACVPFNLRNCAEKLRTGFSRLYQRRLMGELQRMIRRKHARTPLPIDLDRIMRSKDFFDFDSAATAVLNGFRDADDYYARSSSAQYLRGVAVPALEIHAADDPFMTPDVVPPAAQLSPSVTIELCAHGGHVGFCAAGPRLRPRWWLEERIPQFLAQHAA
ncbi:MAG: hydrolase [Gammaproteobacteria bacterium]